MVKKNYKINLSSNFCLITVFFSIFKKLKSIKNRWAVEKIFARFNIATIKIVTRSDWMTRSPPVGVLITKTEIGDWGGL